MGGQQLIQCPVSDLRGNVRSIGGKCLDQQVCDRLVRPAGILLPADNQPDAL
jgi:hypothetical protein